MNRMVVEAAEVRVYRGSTVHDPTTVKDFPKEAKLLDPRPLIYFCDLHSFVPTLTTSGPVGGTRARSPSCRARSQRPASCSWDPPRQ